MKESWEYELLSIEWELNYDFSEAAPPRMVMDGSNEKDSDAPAIQYDENGIPMGVTEVEIKERRQKIFAFYENWKQTHSNKCVFNKSLNSEIFIRSESVIEAAEHAAKRYKSTLAVFRLDEVLEGASFVDYDRVKEGNKNQSKLSKMILMSYRFSDIGCIKLTVGIRKRSEDKIQYGISAVVSEQQIRPKVRNKKAPHKK